MRLSVYVLRRLLLAVPVLLGVTFVTFALSWVATDGHLERAYITERMKPEAVEQVIRANGFDRPWYVQFVEHLKRLARFDLGLSHSQGDRPVSEVFAEFFPATIELSIVAMLFAVALGLQLGVLSAVRRDRPVDHATRLLALSGVSVPIFWLGILLKFALATTYPEEMFASAGTLGMGVFLAVAFAIPVGLGLLLAGSVESAPSRRSRLVAMGGVGAALVAVPFVLGAPAIARFALVAFGTAFAALGLARLTGASRVRRREWGIVLAATAVVAFSLAATPMGTAAVHGVFATLPDLPLGGRFSNDLIAIPGEHPSLTEGPTRFLLVDTALARDWVALRDVAWHLVLPGVTLGYATMAILTRMMRSSMIEVLSQDYVRTARAKGLTEREVVHRHAKRNAMIPTTTVIGLSFGGLLGGAVLTETIFQWPGLGRWSTFSIVSVDTNSVMSFTLLVAVIYVVVNLVVDLLYAYFDPRVRLG